MITKDELSHWLSVCDATSDKPWVLRRRGKEYTVLDENGFWVAEFAEAENDARFTAVASEAFPRAIARIQELEREVVSAREATRQYSAAYDRSVEERHALKRQLAEVTEAKEEACEIANRLAVRDPLDDTCVVCQEQIVEGHECRVLHRLAALRSIGKGGDRG